MRDSFIFYRSFADALATLPDKERLEVYDSIISYGIRQELPKTSGITQTIFLLVKPNLDANFRRYKNGTRGGRPWSKGIQHNQTITKGKPNHNQTITKGKPNVDVDVDVDVDVNDNVDVINPALKKIVDFYNQTFEKDISSYASFEKNYQYWDKIHDAETMGRAIANARKDKFWKDKLTLTILFRRKNPRGEEVDNIQDLANRDEQQSGRYNIDII